MAEEELKEPGELETATEFFPELPDWEWIEDAEEYAQVHEASLPTAEPQMTGEEELLDHEYYEELERKKKEDTERSAQRQNQEQRPARVVVEVDYDDSEDDEDDEQPAVAVQSQKTEEEELPDYDYYEQLEQEEKEAQKSDAEHHVQEERPGRAIVEEDYDDDEDYDQPVPAAPEDDLPDYEYYEQLEQDEKEAGAKRNAEQHIQVERPGRVIVEEDYEDYEDYEQPNLVEENEDYEQPNLMEENEDVQENTKPTVQAQQSSSTATPDDEYIALLKQDTPAEVEMQLKSQHSVQVAESDTLTAIAALNTELYNPSSPSTSPPPSSSSVDMDYKYGPEAERNDWLSRCTIHRNKGSAPAKPKRPTPRTEYKVLERPDGNVAIVKVRRAQRLDRAMWQAMLHRKTVALVKECEKYLPVEIQRKIKEEPES